jgi:hypothetical protein
MGSGSFWLRKRVSTALHVKAGGASVREDLVADFSDVEARSLLRQELPGLAAQGVAEHRVDDRLGERA